MKKIITIQQCKAITIGIVIGTLINIGIGVPILPALGISTYALFVCWYLFHIGKTYEN